MTGADIKILAGEWAREVALAKLRTSPSLDHAQVVLCRLPTDRLGRILVKAGELKLSEDPKERATGELLEAQVLFAMDPKWDKYREDEP